MATTTTLEDEEKQKKQKPSTSTARAAPSAAAARMASIAVAAAAAVQRAMARAREKAREAAQREEVEAAAARKGKTAAATATGDGDGKDDDGNNNNSPSESLLPDSVLEMIRERGGEPVASASCVREITGRATGLEMLQFTHEEAFSLFDHLLPPKEAVENLKGKEMTDALLSFWKKRGEGDRGEGKTTLWFSWLEIAVPSSGEVFRVKLVGGHNKGGVQFRLSQNYLSVVKALGARVIGSKIRLERFDGSGGGGGSKQRSLFVATAPFVAFPTDDDDEDAPVAGCRWDAASTKALLDALKIYHDTKDPDALATWAGVAACDETGALRDRKSYALYDRLVLLAKKSPAELARNKATINLSAAQLATLRAYGSRKNKGGAQKSFLA
jgi:hypothetical protein